MLRFSVFKEGGNKMRKRTLYHHYLNLKSSLLLCVLAILIFIPAHSFAAFIEVGFTEYNRSLNDMTNGGYYGTGGTITYAGIPLTIADGTGGSHNIWNGVNDADNTMEITTSITHADTVYTMISSFWGTNGTDIGFLEFFGTNSAYYRYDLVEGWNVRDHFVGSFVNFTNSSDTIDDVFSPGGRVHLDMQVIDLPSIFSSETLTKISITSNDRGLQGVPFLAAMTVSAADVPEPSTLLLLGSGLAGLGFIRRRFKA